MHGTAWYGAARPDTAATARHGAAPNGTARQSAARHGTARNGAARPGVPSRVKPQRATTRRSTVHHVVSWCRKGGARANGTETYPSASGGGQDKDGRGERRTSRTPSTTSTQAIEVWSLTARLHAARTSVTTQGWCVCVRGLRGLHVCVACVACVAWRACVRACVRACKPMLVFLQQPIFFDSDRNHFGGSVERSLFRIIAFRAAFYSIKNICMGCVRECCKCVRACIL